MSNFQWRRFNFFDSKKVATNALNEALSESKVTATTSGRGHLVFGDSSGRLHFLDRKLEEVKSMKVFDVRVSHVTQLRQSGLLISVGIDDSDQSYLKVYDLDKPDSVGGGPTLTRITRIDSIKRTITALTVHENQSLMALGFQDGIVRLFRGEVSRDRGSKVKDIVVDENASITGLALRTTSTDMYLYVSTPTDVYSFNVSVREKENKVHLDSLGCSAGLAIQVDMQLDTHFVMGRSDAIYCYTPEHRSQCYAFEGEKCGIFWFRNYLVLASSDSENHQIALTIFDVQNKFIAFTTYVKPHIKALLSEWGNLYLLHDDNDLIELIEKDTQSKLDILFKKNSYDIAIKIAKSHGYDSPDGLADIFRQYGDHLYSKGDYAAAIDNYAKTIGSLEPSYVIRRFLDAQRIHDLTTYLQCLHREGLANEDHTTLLLNCYTKLKDHGKLDEFIMTENREIDFDVDIAIKVCRQAGYYRHCLSLARKHRKHEWYLKIQLEDNKDYEDALRYISDLHLSHDNDAAVHNLKKYGSVLISATPQATTDLVIRLCSANGEDSSDPQEFLHLFFNMAQPHQMIAFLEEMIRLRTSSTPATIYHTLLEHYLSSNETHHQKALELLQRGETGTDTYYDRDQALIICKAHGFHAGVLYLFERNGLYEEVIKHHVHYGTIDDALTACRQFGAREPQLWVSLLKLLVSSSPSLSINSQHIAEILEKIERSKLLSQLEIISLLCSTPHATLGLVRDYLIRFLETEDATIEENWKVIDQYKADTERIRNQIHKLETEVTIFQGSKCSACPDELKLPSVFFLCQHAFHKQCFQSFSESESECPVCLDVNKKILDIIESQELSRDSHDAFHYQLDTANDGFSVVAEYFGRGMFRTEDEVDILKQNQRRTLTEKITELSVVEPLSEGRLRTQQPSHSYKETSEARLRYLQREEERPQETSEARLRLQQDPFLRQREETKRVTEAPKKEYNPFDEDSPIDSTNPFYEKEDNPFTSQEEKEEEEEEESKNPFDEDYDEKLNPFFA